MKTEICIRVLTPKPLTDYVEAATTIEIMLDLLPEITPEKYGSWEPLKKRFDKQNLTSIISECWPYGDFLWARKNPYAVGGMKIQSGKSYVHSGPDIDCAFAVIPQSRLINYLHTVSVFLAADLSILHLINHTDIERGRETQTIIPAAKDECYFGVTTHNLKKYIPDLYWGMVFGPAYVKLFGLEKLLSAPAHTVMQLGPEMVYIQLSENLEDFRNNFPEVDKVRARVKKHLGASAFYRSGLLSHFKKTATFNIIKVPHE